MRERYTLTLTRDGNVYTIKSKTYADVAKQVNELMGFRCVSSTIITNWLSRGKKSNKYDFITLH